MFLHFPNENINKLPSVGVVDISQSVNDDNDDKPLLPPVTVIVLLVSSKVTFFNVYGVHLLFKEVEKRVIDH